MQTIIHLVEYPRELMIDHCSGGLDAYSTPVESNKHCHSFTMAVDA
jgi:hypothetical protein